MAKYLLLILVIMIVLWGLTLRAARRGRPQASEDQANPQRQGDKGGASAEAIVPCAHCGIHLPRREALSGPRTGSSSPVPDQHYYCCAEHRDRGPAGRPPA